jgi:hypothetical protein
MRYRVIYVECTSSGLLCWRILLVSGFRKTTRYLVVLKRYAAYCLLTCYLESSIQDAM